MTDASRALRIAVAGAGGTSGGLVVAAARAASVDVVATVGRAAIAAGAAAVAGALGGCDVVVSCAGPYADAGPIVEDGARAAGVPVVHLAAERAALLELFARAPALERDGATVVAAAGFATGVAELACWLAAKGLAGAVDVEVAHAVSAVALPSAGSLSSYVADAGDDDDAGPLRAMELPAPFGARAVREVPRPVEALVLPRAFPAIGGVRALYAVGPARLVEASAAAPVPFLRDRAALERMRALRAGTDARGPTAEERAATRFAVVVTARDGAHVHRVEMSGADPYGVTAIIALACARAVASPARRAGAFTPIGVIDAQATLAALARAGVRWRSDRRPR